MYCRTFVSSAGSALECFFPRGFAKASTGYWEEKGTSQTQPLVRPQRTGYAVGCRIREMRGFDMTQERFAERNGISQNYLSTMERGNVEIGAEILLRISREFVKSVEWLLTGEG